MEVIEKSNEKCVDPKSQNWIEVINVTKAKHKTI